ncbi:MAG: molybdopterin biosynthesis protein [Chloroflexi bacterium]|nr:MAG: molybdopterin biosynthesis protein [Chloroflexota bacterium]
MPQADSFYLHDIPLEQAWQRFDQALESAGMNGVLGSEEVELDEGLIGRVTAAPVWALTSSPNYHSAAMDGFALRSETIHNAMPTAPVILAVGEQAAYVDTGDPLPVWANCVVPIENVEPLNLNGAPAANARKPEQIRLRAALPPWSHVRPMGEDIVATQLILPSGHVLRPVDLGAAAASGHKALRIAKKPAVAIFPTGSELVALGSEVRHGDIIESNSLVLAGQVHSWGGIPHRFPIIPDDLAKIRSQVLAAAEDHDLILLNAGSSAGAEDFSAQVIAELGQVLVHGVAVRPGHPVILGMLRRSDGKMIPIIGVPGYPVSAALTGEIFVEPLLARWTGRSPARPIEIEAAITRKITSPAGDDDYIRVVVGRVGERLLAAPLARGAGVITSLVRADGLTVLPRGTQGVEAGAKIRVRLYRAPELEQTIFCIGSHDVTLDLLAQALATKSRRLVSANAGSQGGLVALRRKEAHLAGAHLLDPASGKYNLAAVRQYLAGVGVNIYGWVGREQGLMVARGNPKGIKGLTDLARTDVIFINRQRGAGTRVLLDYQLEKSGITPTQVNGYDLEEFTHLAVAAAVASGRADCGLGIPAAAQALGLDFIPLFHEHYDLIIPIEFAAGPLLAPLFEIMHNETFKRDVAALPGYDISRMGTLIAETAT